MKNKYLIGILCFCTLSLGSCIEDFLDRESKNLQTENSAFKTYDNFKTYSWGLYTIFPGANSVWRADAISNLMTNNTSTRSNVWAYQNVTETTENSSWNFDYIRRVNVMLDNIDNGEITDAQKEHWRSVGLFFRSFKYFDLLSKYGGIPWAEHVVTEDDEDIIFGKRDDRDVVAANILKDLKYAEANINPDATDKDTVNTINTHVVRALISRFGLFEGTWRKYHGLNDAETYLRASTEASEKLMASFPELHSSYEEVFNSLNLEGMNGIILYYKYIDNILTHTVSRQIRASSFAYELTKEMVESYLCLDGKPISQSPLYHGDKTPWDEFRNRDRRLLYTAVPPSRFYKQSAASLEWRFLRVGETVQIGTNTVSVTREDSIQYREYYDLLNEISKPSLKSFPLFAWNYTLPTNYTPRFRNYPEGISPFSGQHGYWFYKYYNMNPEEQATCSHDMPIFRMGEVLLNYAEAKFELGEFTQDVADRTINKLRARGAVADMVVSEINDSFDANRDQTVPAVLWEIRRERNIELIGENFAFNDMRRWRKGHYLDKQIHGCWLKNSDYNNTLRILGYSTIEESKDKEGYVVYLDEPRGWLDHYYLYPIPINDLVLNPQLEQNPGYNKP